MLLAKHTHRAGYCVFVHTDGGRIPGRL